MARLTIQELLALVVKAPEYKTSWEMGVPAEQAFYVRFADQEIQSVKSTVMPTADGSDLVIDVNADGVVVGIEIV